MLNDDCSTSFWSKLMKSRDVVAYEWGLSYQWRDAPKFGKKSHVTKQYLLHFGKLRADNCLACPSTTVIDMDPVIVMHIAGAKLSSLFKFFFCVLLQNLCQGGSKNLIEHGWIRVAYKTPAIVIHRLMIHPKCNKFDYYISRHGPLPYILY